MAFSSVMARTKHTRLGTGGAVVCRSSLGFVTPPLVNCFGGTAAYKFMQAYHQTPLERKGRHAVLHWFLKKINEMNVIVFAVQAA